MEGNMQQAFCVRKHFWRYCFLSALFFFSTGLVEIIAFRALIRSRRRIHRLDGADGVKLGLS